MGVTEAKDSSAAEACRLPVETAFSGRVYALDALRGFAILAMVLSGLLPSDGLPSWMYHAQDPPPTHQTNFNLPGITWVDLVFPFFLFALGAAIPLAWKRRLEKGMPARQAVLQILKRGFLLGFFAIYQQHLSPFNLGRPPGAQAWLTALAGFALLFPILARLPQSLKPAWQWTLRLAGWSAAILLLAGLHYPSGPAGFSLARGNVILIVLANVAVFGSLIWLLTRENWLFRLGFLLLGFAIRCSRDSQTWVQWTTDLTPASWIFQPRYLKYLFIVIPGTIAGDMIVSWMRSLQNERKTQSWPAWRLASTVALMGVLVVVNLVGLKARWVEATVIADFSLCALGAALLARPANASERLLHNLYLWGVYWLALGLLFEPYQGGIKKSYATMSYYFVTTGLALFVLLGFTIVIDLWQKRRWVQLLIDNGQNPMIAYVGAGNLVLPLLALTHARQLLVWLAPSGWPGALCAATTTLLVALAVSLFTKKRIFWRT